VYEIFLAAKMHLPHFPVFNATLLQIRITSFVIGKKYQLHSIWLWEKFG